MLRQLRKRKTMKRILWALAILIIPPFAFWGAGSALRTREKGPTCAGVVFDRKVSFEEYSAAWQAVRNQAIMTYGPRLDEVLDSLRLDQQAWERIILLRDAKRKRFTARDKELVQTIARLPFFQSKGKFDERAYDMILKQVFRTDARQFEEELRGTLAIAKLRNFIIKDVKITDDEVKEEYKKEYEKTKIAYILTPPAQFKKDINIKEEALKKYYVNNAELFKVKDHVNIQYLGFEFADYQKDIQISDEQAKAYYDEHKDEFDKEKEFNNLKETIKNDLTLQKARDAALMAAEKIDYILADKAKSFEEAAKENSIPVKETGFFGAEGVIPQIGWFPEIQKIAFKLNVGERSELIKSKVGFTKGFYIIKVKEKKPAYIPVYEEIKEKIENVLKEDAAKKLALKETKRLHRRLEEIMKGKNIKFEEAVLSIRRRAKHSEPFTRNDYVQGIGPASELGEAAFTTKPGGISDIAKTRAGFSIFTVLEVTSVDEEKFKADKEEFSKKVLEAKELKVLQEWYYKLIESANLKSNIPIDGQLF